MSPPALRSRVCVGHVSHRRLEPVRHGFTYRTHVLLLELSELPALARAIPALGYNERRPFSIRDEDYLRPGRASLAKKLLDELGPDAMSDVTETTLVTNARFLGLCFNPVSFFLCRRGDSIRCGVAEVRNTFGEKHLYRLDRPEEPRDGAPTRFMTEKRFYVSPFNGVQGTYTFEFSRLSGDTLDIRTDLSVKGRSIVQARLWGEIRPLTSSTLLSANVGAPIAAWMSRPQITWEALRLRFQRGLSTVMKPRSSSDATISTGRRVPWT